MTSDEDFDVALSFAGEDRDYAEALADALRQYGVKVFYDKYEQAMLWGKDLYTYLSDLYQNRARYCVMLLSQHYAAKLWTNHERQSAQARAFREHKEYILPVRLDDTEIPGLLPTIGYMRWPPENARTIASAIMAKLNKEIASTEQSNPSVKVEAQLHSQSIYGVVERFKQIFTSHSISLTQIPRFIDARFRMSLGDLRTEDTLLLKLNDEMLYWVAETFNVRRRWIDGDDECIYATPDYYKCVYKFIDFFVDLLARGYEPEVFAFKTTKELSTDIALYSYVGLLISIEIGAIDGKPVRRYYPIQTDWLWHHWRSRYEFESIVYLLGLLSVYPRSFDLAPNLLGLLRAGWIFPEPMLRAQGIGYPPYTTYSWYPDDYVETEGGGARREIEEADEIIKFVHDEGYFKRLQQKIQEHDLWIRSWEVVKTLGGYPKLRT